jgi:hypothetical protein
VRVHCDEGVATHVAPDPCAVLREDDCEASVGERIGQPLSRESVRNSVPTLFTPRKAKLAGASLRVPAGPGVVLDPGMYGRSLRGNREISGSAIGAVVAGWSVAGR